MKGLFNYKTAEYKEDKRDKYDNPNDITKPIVSNLEKMKNVLGKLKKDIQNKERRLGIALGAPIVVMSGGAETLEFVGGQYGGGASADAYSAPDDASQVVFSTARILANILKSHEDELIKAVENDALEKIRDSLITLHENEQQLFGAVYALGESGELVDKAPSITFENMTDNGKRKKYMKALADARTAHAAATNTRVKIFNVITSSIK